jgi:4-amino-4-deoxy-L-arabinose transferase-like glycosyltransferase
MIRIRTWLQTESRLHLILLTLILLMGFAVRFYYSSVIPILGDESESYFNYIKQPLLTTISRYDQPNNHIFHSLLAHLSINLFGDYLWALRLPAFAAGVLILPLTYLLARRLYDKNTALLAVGIAATSVWLVHESTHARGYPIAGMLFVLQLILAHQLLSNWQRRTLFAFALTGALQLYTMPSSLYAVGIPIVWLVALLMVRDRKWISRTLIELFIACLVMGALTILFYLPVILRSGISGVRTTIALYSDPPMAWSQLPTVYLRNIRKFISDGIRGGYSLPISVGLLGGVAASLVADLKLWRGRAPIILAVGIWLALVLGVQRIVPFVRVWSFIFPLIFVLAAAGLVYLISRIQQSEVISTLIVVVMTGGLLASLLINNWPVMGFAYGWGYPRLGDAISDLQAVLKPDDVIGDVGLITVNPMRYHFQQLQLDTDFVAEDSNLEFSIDSHPKRIFVLVPITDNEAEPFDQVLNENAEAAFPHQARLIDFLLHEGASVYSKRSLLGTYDNFAIYMLEE